jgi:lysosomal alpha-mannosidase
MIKRVRDYRPTWTLDVTEPVAGNYYPVNSRMIVQDPKSEQQVNILTDRSQGGSSMEDGSVELMVHRRLLFDDAFGVGEPLNESAYGQGLVVRGKHWLQFVTGEAVASQRHRFKAQEIFMDSQLTFMPTSLSLKDWLNKFKMEYSSMSSSKVIPANVHMLTLEEWAGNSRDSVLIRFEHLFEAHEDPKNMSKPVVLKLDNLFTAFDVSAVEEVTLGANLNKDKLKRFNWNVANEMPLSDFNKPVDEVKAEDGWSVSLGPFQIRTFILDLKPKA